MRKEKLTAYKAWKKGDFIYCSVIVRPGQDTEIIVAHKSGKHGRCRVRNLGRPDEEILEDEEL